MFIFNKNKLLLIILLMGFILRVIPILWGVPINSYIHNYHADEPKVYDTILNFPGNYFSTQKFMGYGTFVQYTLGILLIPLKLLFKVLAFQENYQIAVIILSRFFNVIMGTISIYFTYYLASKIFDEKTGLIAALLLSLSFYHVINSAIITLDVVMGLLLVINFLLCFKAVSSNNLIWYIILGILSGMLLSTKITGGLFLFVPLILILLKLRENPENIPVKKFRLELLKYACIYLLTSVFIFLLFNPHVYLDPHKYINYFLQGNKDWIERTSVSTGETLLKWLQSTIILNGLPITVFTLIGLIIFRRRKLKFQLSLLFFVLIYYCLWRWFLPPRYLIWIAPILCIFAANALIYFLEKRNILLRRIVTLLLIITAGFSLYLSISGIKLRLEDTRTQAAIYIDKNINKGSSIGLAYASEKYNWKTHDWRYPKINFSKYKEENFLNEPDIIIVTSYDFKPITETLNTNKINSDFTLKKEFFREWYLYSPPSPEIFKFYSSLFHNKNNYVLIKSFKENINVPVEFPPPEIRIYEKME